MLLHVVYQQIVLRNLNQPKKVSIKEDIDWLCDSFGFSSGRDTHKMASQIIHTLLQEFVGAGVGSTEKLADELHVAPQRVNYHIRSLVDSGFIYRDGRLILLREGSVKAAVEEMRKDANRMFDKLSEIGEEIDSAIGLRNR